MKISEMSLDQLRDHALAQESKINALEEEKKTAAADLEELRKTNLLLQTRNNELFMRVEQQHQQQPEGDQDDQDDHDDHETCEEFAIKNMKGIMNL